MKMELVSRSLILIKKIFLLVFKVIENDVSCTNFSSYSVLAARDL